MAHTQPYDPRNEDSYDTWEYGTEPLPHDNTWQHPPASGCVSPSVRPTSPTEEATDLSSVQFRFESEVGHQLNNLHMNKQLLDEAYSLFEKLEKLCWSAAIDKDLARYNRYNDLERKALDRYERRFTKLKKNCSA